MKPDPREDWWLGEGFGHYLAGTGNRTNHGDTGFSVAL